MLRIGSTVIVFGVLLGTIIGHSRNARSHYWYVSTTTDGIIRTTAEHIEII